MLGWDQTYKGMGSKITFNNKQINKMDKIYISGKITGLEFKVAYNLFEEAATNLESDYDVVNPIKDIPYNKDWTWDMYMIADLELMFKCNTIYMLDNWKDSKGARIEHAIAKELGFTIIYQ